MQIRSRFSIGSRVVGSGGVCIVFLFGSIARVICWFQILQVTNQWTSGWAKEPLSSAAIGLDLPVLSRE